MEFVGELVKHKAFGLGKILEFKDTYIIVEFEDGSEKDFVFPDAFDLYLALENNELANKVEEKLVVYRIKEAERKLREEEIRSEAIRLDMMREEAEKAKKAVIKKVDSNIVFKSTYCDGGSNNNSIGYKAVCSDEMINYNINKKKNKICSSPNSNCYKYLQGNISRTELDSNENLCYEGRLLEQWRSIPDITYSGVFGVKAKKLKNINPGSLVLLSTVLPNEKERDRVIFAAYLLQENYELDYNGKGYLGADEKYKIELSLDESKKVKFWDYYFNQKNPEKIVNSSGLYRYFDDVQAAQTLKTISEIKKGTEDEELSVELLDRYCKIKNIDINVISELKGALQVQKALTC